MISFDQIIREIRVLGNGEAAPRQATHVSWVLPGFINAHCHLEYSWLAGQMPRGPIPFGKWVQAIMSARPQDDQADDRKLEAMKSGALALLSGGCTMVWDSTTDGKSAAVLSESGLPYYLFREVLGLTEQRARPIWQNAVTTSAGLNPHAPYSVGAWLRQQLRTHSDTGRLQAWHLAETPDEEELFHSATGSIADLYEHVGLPLPFDACPQTSSFMFLQREGLLDPASVVFHGNHLTLGEAAYFKSPRAIVHCPGTHRWFQRDPIPLRQWLDADANVCLGTDSLASSESLSMLEMIRIVAQDYADLTADDILQMACTNPASVLQGAQTRENTGMLAAGFRADFIALHNSVNQSDWRSLVTDSTSAVSHVWVAGTLTHNPH